MKIEVKEAPYKMVLFWITKGEGENKEFLESLKPMFKEYKAKKYLPVVMESGTGNLEDSMYLLMKQNYEALARKQLRRERELER